MPILREFRNIDRGLRPGQKWPIFLKKKKWSMKKENGSYSVMDIKKVLRMIRLCTLQYEMTMPFPAQQTRIFVASRYSLHENPMEILQGMLCQKALNSI